MQRFSSIKWKFLAVCLAFLTLPTVIFGFVIYRTYYREALENMQRDLVIIATGWQTTADVYHDELNRILKREEVLVEKRLESISQGVKIMVEHQLEHADDPAKLEALYNKLSNIRIGRNGYIFIIGEDGRYILSKERKYDGMKVGGLAQPGSAQSFDGIFASARNLNSDDVRIVHYPWTDPGQPDVRMKIAAIAYIPEKNWVIAASAYYTDFKSYELEKILANELKDRMAHQKIGAKGYVFAIDRNGRFVVSKDRLRDNEDLSGYQDQTGAYVFRNIVSRARAMAVGQSFIAQYNWKDLDDDRPKRKLAAIVYDPGWDWVIGASIYEENFLKGLAAIRWNLIEICVLFVLIGMIVALFFANRITQPIVALQEIALKGDLNVVMDPKILLSRDEIGNLGVAFQDMMANLREKIRELEESRQALIVKNEELRRAQMQLVQSEKLAAIGQLAAGVAHEINNPLAYVMSNLETLEQYIQAYESVLSDIEKYGRRQDHWRSTEDARHDVAAYFARFKGDQFGRVRTDIGPLIRELQVGLERVKRIVMDLRTYARTEHEDKTNVRIEDVLEQVITIVWSQIKYKSELVRDYGPTPLVNCQPQRMGQVFINILVNAVQSIRSDKGEIRLKTHADEEWVYVEIVDNGDGIKEEHIPKVFEPFFTTKPVGEGTGLGLSISYEIVKMHGGDIRVASALGSGSSFTVLLPRNNETAAVS